MRTALLAVAALLALPVPALPGLFPAALPVPVTLDATVTVDATAPGTPFPRGLLGVAHAPTSPDGVAALRAMGVPHLRIDAYLERASLGPGAWDWVAFDRELALAVEVGAQPVLILAYTPAWLAACPPPVPSRTCMPADLAAWRGLVAEASARAAVGFGVRHFEVWNEPDNPGFWTGSLADYLALYEASALGVGDAARATGLALRVGGPATWHPDAPWIAGLLAWAGARGLPVDFVSYHWYADHPLHGPVGPLPGTVVTDSPAVLARSYHDQAVAVRALVDALGFPAAEVWVDEWNVNGGDAPRMRGPFGAAFLVAVARELQRAGADRANFFNAEHAVWGLLEPGGAPRPSGKALGALLALGPEALPVQEEGSPFVVAMAARREGGAVAVVLTNFDAQADAAAGVLLKVPGKAGAWTEVRDLDGALLHAGPLPAEGLALRLENLDVRLVRVA